MANTGFLQASTDLDYILVAIANKDLVPDRYRKYGNPVFGFTGKLFAWGFGGFYGQLGLSNLTTYSSPVQVGTNTNWSQISGGGDGVSHFGRKTDGTLWSWGYNPFGRLGLNDTSNRSSPIQVGSGTDWNLVKAGKYQTIATKTNGTLWAWGYNYGGPLGQNDTTNRSSPVQVGTNTNWSTSRTAISMGDSAVAAIKTDGTLWAWGYNNYGQLGHNDRTNRSSPVQVGTGTNWSYIIITAFSSLAIKTDGTLWAWGYNTEGLLGLNDLTNRSSPIQVGSATNWKRIIGSGSHTLGVKTDGTLWSWGPNNFGQLGQNDRTNRSSPVQVGSGTNWDSVFSVAQASFAIKTDGTLWTWGRNTAGRLGLNNSSDYSSPVQVGSGTGWQEVSSHTGTVNPTDVGVMGITT